MSTFKIHTHCDMGWIIRNQKATDNQNNTITYSAYICCKKIKIPISFVLNNANIQESYFVNSHTNYIGENTWSSTYTDNTGNMYPVYFSNNSGFTKKLTPGFPLEGEGTFTFVYTVTTDDWNAYGPDSADTENRWSGIPFFNPDDSLSFSMSAAEVGVDTIVSITVTSTGTRSSLTGLSFYGNGTSDTINKTAKNLTNFSKIVINDFGGVFLSRNRSSEVLYGQFENLPTLSFEGKANEAGPRILTGTSLQICFSLCNNFNENLNSWDFSEVVNMRSMCYGIPNSGYTTYQFNKLSNNPELNYLSINSESIEPSTTYTIKVRQVTDDNGLILFRHLDYFTSQNRLDLLTVNGSVTLVINNFQVEFNIQNVTFSGTVARSGESESDALWTFTVVSSSTMTPVVIPEETNNLVFLWKCNAFNKFNNGGVQPNWNTQKVSSMIATFYSQNELNFEFQFDTSSVKFIHFMFAYCSLFNNGDQAGSSTKPLTLNLPEALELQYMFGKSSLDQTVTLTAPKAQKLKGMFWGCTSFNNGGQPLTLNLPEALDLNYMFDSNAAFDQTVTLTAPKAQTLQGMFWNCPAFNNGSQPLALNLPEALYLNYMFSGHSSFDQTVTLTVPKAQKLTGLFWGCTSFNNGGQPLTLNLPEALDLNYMFSRNYSFDQTVTLTAPKAQKLTGLFYNCTSFNNGGQPLTLNLPEALDLIGMFDSNAAFDQTVTLTAPQAQTLSYMFWGCTSFNNGGQNFSNKDGEFWKISNVNSMEGMFDQTHLSDIIYSNFLVGCKNQIPDIKTGVQLGANATPTDDGVDAKTILESEYSWQIIDMSSWQITDISSRQNIQEKINRLVIRFDGSRGQIDARILKTHKLSTECCNK